MVTATNRDKVRVHYRGTFNDGTVFDSSTKDNPLEFVIGEGKLLKKFEEGVIGLSVGESRKIHIPMREGYGLREENLVATIPREHLPDGIEPKAGKRFKAQTSHGELIIKIVTANEKEITIDANHDLAGQDLTFEVELIDIIS
jgi:peptidylprolyl isomerase